jgi:flagellar hook-basal body complex protein FliE
MTLINPAAHVGATTVAHVNPGPKAVAPDNSFTDTLKSSIRDVNRLQVETDTAIRELVAGNENNVHEVMVAMEKASISLELMVQVRNKIIAAYDEIKRMQI